MLPVASLLVDVAGYVTGIALYLMLALMVARERVREGRSLLWPGGRLPLLTGLCGLVWNVGALIALVTSVAGKPSGMPLVVATAFAALGFLPAVVVHALAESREAVASTSVGRSMVAVSYGLSGVAAGLHFAAAARGDAVPSHAALWLLTVGFVALMVVLLVMTRDQPIGRRGTWVAALALFALSTLHFGRHSGNEAWWVELIGHHASLPLALCILLQDYRFAFADLFLKSAMALLLLVAVSLGVCLGVFVPLMRLHAATGGLDPTTLAAMVLVWVVVASSLPMIRRVSTWLVDSVVLRRPDYDKTLASFVDTIEQAETDVDVERRLGLAVRRAMGAVSAMTVADPFPDVDRRVVIAGADLRSRAVEPSASFALRLRTVEPPQPALVFGPLAAGRRLLSDDIRLLEAMSRWAARRVDSIRVARERLERDLREGNMRRLATEAELRALRAQLNPHFLFNALTSIGYLIEANPPRAVDALIRLTSLLRSVLSRSATEFSTLGDEMDLVRAYLDLEQIRFEERLTVDVDVPTELNGRWIPTLILQPIVENAIKHGLEPLRAGGTVRVVAAADGDRLRIVVEDSGRWSSPVTPSGVGLRSVTDRLRSLYDGRATLDISSSEQGTRVAIELPEAAVGHRANRLRRRVG
jgi:two-component system, LytTR family, sensor kinase